MITASLALTIAALIITLLTSRARRIRQARTFSTLIVTESQRQRLAELDDRYQRLMRSGYDIRGELDMRQAICGR